MSSRKSDKPAEQDDDFAGPIYSPKHACLVLKEANFVDWIIECGTTQFHVERGAFYYKSDFFRAAMDNDFKEKETGILPIGEAKPKTVALVILFCYTGKILPSALEQAWPKIFTANSYSTDAFEKIRDACDLYQLADRLMLASLKTLAAVLFIELWEDTLKNTEAAPKARTLLESCYDSLPEEHLLRSALTAVVFHKRAAGDQLFQVARKYDRQAVFVLTVSSDCRDHWIGTAQSVKKLFAEEAFEGA